MKKTNSKTEDSADTTILDSGECVFAKTDGGFLSLKIGKKRRIPRVHVYRAFPLSGPDEYISVRDTDDREIGLIVDLRGFSSDNRKLIEDELDRRYFTPTITELLSLKDEFGYTYWDVLTDAGACRFTVKNDNNTVISLGDDVLLIIDVDGNRFEFPGFSRINTKHQRLIESML